jgi:hypothetical protein
MMEDVTVTRDPVAQGPTTGGGRWRLVSVALAVLLVAAVAGLGLLWHDRSDLQDLQDQRAAEGAATDAAEQVVVAWMSYDYRTYDDVSWITDDGTAGFQQSYDPDALVAARKKLIGDHKLVSIGRVVNAAATAKDADHVKVILFTDQTISDEQMRRQGKDPLHARSGVELSMVREDGRWLADDMVQLQFE